MTGHIPVLWFSSPRKFGESDCACAAAIWHSSPPDDALESDCACATQTGPLVSSPPSATYTFPSDVYRAPLANEYEVAFNPRGTGHVVVLNKPAAEILDRFVHPAPLDHPLAHQLAALGILMPYPVPDTLPPALPTMLTAWLHVTSQCNLACPYCFASRRRESMTLETGLMAVERLFQTAQEEGFQGVKIKYAGGEPTLNMPLVRALHQQARRLAGRSGLQVNEVILTNGTLLDRPTLQWLHEENIRLSISLDGIGAVQDRLRPRLSGGGTFTQVASAVEDALDVGLRPHLSITVTRHNVDTLAEIGRFALDRGVTFNLNFVRPLPGQPHLMPEPERLIAGVRSLLAMLNSRPHLFRLIDSLLDRCDLHAPHRYPCGAGRTYIAVDPQGHVAPCHMLLDSPQAKVTHVSDIHLLERVRAAVHVLRNPAVDEKSRCRTCPWRYICGGGCPLLSRWYHGKEEASSPYCQVYRTLIPELLQAEGLRILRTQKIPV